MKKISTKYKNQSISELISAKNTITAEIMKLKIEEKVKPAKDTNLISKKKRELSIISTFITMEQLRVIENQK